MRRLRRTKIVATLGPATDDPATVGKVFNRIFDALLDIAPDR